MTYRTTIIAMTAWLWIGFGHQAIGVDASLTDFEEHVRPLLKEHCFACHGVEHQEGEVSFALYEDVAAALGQRKLWRSAAAQISAGNMPPEGETPLSNVEKERLLAWMQLAAAYVDRSANHAGPALIRQLSASEYERTIRDLIGIEFDADVAVGMQNDATGSAPGSLAVTQAMPPTLLDKYLEAADKILDIVFFGVEEDSSTKLDASHRRQADQAYHRLMFIQPGDGVSEREAAQQILARFLRRAYRRPVADDELKRYLSIYDRRASEAASFDRGVRSMMKPILVSPHFLYRIERNPLTDAPCYRISDHELATRLSYFLWSTMPDDELSSLADDERLHTPEVLQQQVRRMLQDDKSKAFTEEFAVQWLQLDNLNDARPSKEFFPAFNDRLRRSMREETMLFFDKLREEDRSIIELIDSDYTYLNRDLAEHYGIAGVTHDELRRVSLHPEDHRGGLLGMGSVLAMTSHTHRTSPTQRGKYILEVVFGTPPPPPPANVSKIDEVPGEKEATSFREQLARHAHEPGCASCHAKMDPLGFALDNYDASGAWRDSTAERPLDTSGRLPSGEEFHGAVELKRVLRQHQDEFVHNLIEQTFTYALGRMIVSTDEAYVRDVQAELVLHDHKFSSLIFGIVSSFPFQYRTNTNLEADSSPGQLP